MKIGIDARMYSSSFTGIGRYVFELARHLFTLAPEHEIILFMNSPQYEAFTPPHPRVKKVLVNARHYSIKEQLHFLKLLRRERLDVMHFTHFNAPLLYRRACVVTIHDLTLSFFPGNKMRSWLHRLAYHCVLGSVVRRAQAVIAVSENTSRDLQRLFHVPASRISVLHEGVGEEFAPIEGEEAREDFFLYTGVWRTHKNVLGLLRAFRLLVDDPSFTGRLVITGKKDPFYPEVEALVRERGLEARVEFTGLVSEAELVSLYQRARAYVMPSFYEGFGLPVLEAMACGTPVACSNTSSLPEIAGEGNALFFDPHSDDDMAQALKKIWEEAPLRAALRTRGLERVKTFSWKRMSEATLALYTGVLRTYP